MRLILHPFYLHFISIICAVAPKYLCFHLSGSNAVNSKVEDWDVWTSKFEAQTPKYQTPLSALLRSALLADPFRLCISSSLSNYHSQQSEVRTEGAVDLGCAIRIAVLPRSLPVFKVNKLKGRLMLLSLSLVHSPVLSLTLRYFLLFPLSCSLQISVCITIFITSSIIRALFAFCLPCSHTIIVRRLLFATFCRENAVCSFLNTFQKVGIQTLRSKLCDSNFAIQSSLPRLFSVWNLLLNLVASWALSKIAIFFFIPLFQFHQMHLGVPFLWMAVPQRPLFRRPVWWLKKSSQESCLNLKPWRLHDASWCFMMKPLSTTSLNMLRHSILRRFPFERIPYLLPASRRSPPLIGQRVNWKFEFDTFYIQIQNQFPFQPYEFLWILINK